MEPYFYEVFENIPRQGPGTKEATKKAFSYLTVLPEVPEILDVGCGKGVQTFHLAELSKGNITAVDNHQFFLDHLYSEATRLHINRIRCCKADMNSLPFSDEAFDLIWSEGAIYIMGMLEALKNWRSLIKPNGYLVFSDLVWMTDERPRSVSEYWEKECLFMQTIEQAFKNAVKLGYKPVNHFSLPLEGWTREYFDPQIKVIRDLRDKYKDNTRALEIFDYIEGESNFVLNNFQYFNYEFFILQKGN